MNESLYTSIREPYFSEKRRTVLVIAGSDPSGGAGVQGDVKTCMANGVFAMGVITALTVQNTVGVSYFKEVDSELITDQLEAVVSDITPDAVKIGMLPSPEAVKAVGDIITRYRLKNIVVDPVLISSSGKQLNTDIEATAIAMEKYLFPYSTLVTPNIPEARYFLKIDDDAFMDPMIIASELVSKWNCEGILLKGGHTGGENSCDILIQKDKSVNTYYEERIKTKNSHGTGCALSSAVASGLALQLPSAIAVGRAKRFITNALRGNSGKIIGKGIGPIDFFAGLLL